MRTIAIIGLGYVGLPLAYHLAKKGNKIIGFDISEQKLSELKNGFDSTEEIWSKISEVNIHYTNNPENLKEAEILIITVPTPVDHDNNPDYTPLIKASTMIGKVLEKWQTIVYESTVDPGCTEEICIPLLEKNSGLKYIQDFHVGYSPERINPWDKEHTVDKIAKVVSASDSETLEILAEMYWSITTGTIHKAPSIKVAETSKIIENTQRDINIAVINEIAKICDKMWINTYDVLDAAATKWNFLKFTPGLVGGHCIGVDPYYLARRAIKVWLHPDVILAGRRINDDMPVRVAHQAIKLLIQANNKVQNANILVLGLTFKENVPDFRNSKIAETIRELKEFWTNITGYDPYHEYLRDYDREELNLTPEEILTTLSNENKYDAVIYAQNHKEFERLDIKSLLKEDWVLFDIKGKLRGQGFKHYKSL